MNDTVYICTSSEKIELEIICPFNEVLNEKGTQGEGDVLRKAQEM